MCLDVVTQRAQSWELVYALGAHSQQCGGAMIELEHGGRSPLTQRMAWRPPSAVRLYDEVMPPVSSMGTVERAFTFPLTSPVNRSFRNGGRLRARFLPNATLLLVVKPSIRARR